MFGVDTFLHLPVLRGRVTGAVMWVPALGPSSWPGEGVGCSVPAGVRGLLSAPWSSDPLPALWSLLPAKPEPGSRPGDRVGDWEELEPQAALSCFVCPD